MSFALLVKQELLSLHYSHRGAIEFISGIIATSILSSQNEYVININNHELANLIRDMLGQMKIKYLSHDLNRNFITLPDFPYEHDLLKIKTPSWYFGGAFVGGGSISKLSASSYHLEIQLHSRFKALEMLNFLNQKRFNFHLIQRRKMWVIYLKRSEQISDFLKAIQAFNSLIKFEDERIIRDYKNHINRYSNLDAYNLQKMANAHVEFELMIDEIKANHLTKLFSEKEQNFFKLKLNNPYVALQELVSLYNDTYKAKITKSGLNHYLIKLKKIVNRT